MRVALWARPAVAAAVESQLAAIAELEVARAETAAAFTNALAHAEAAILPISNYDPAISQALSEARHLRWVQLLSVGVEQLLARPLPPHIAVTTAGESMAAAIAEHAMGLLLALSRNFTTALARQLVQRWDIGLRGGIVGLQGKTLAIVGYGAIGRQLARRARAFEMRVVGLRRQPLPHADADEMLPASELDAVLPRADAIVITAPLNSETHGLFDAQRLALCRPGALLVNVARGAIVDTQALVAALAAGRLAGAGLDVVDPEPLPPAHPLWSNRNVILTPHVAAGGSDTELARLTATNARRLLAGQPLLAQVAGPVPALS